MKKFLIKVAPFAGLMPAIAFAQVDTVSPILTTILGIVNILVTILIVAAVAYFIWGVIKYITASDENARAEGRKSMINGIIGLGVIVAIWGILGFIGNFLGVGIGGTTNIPL